jgi:protein-tyrosine phosphatase
VSHILFVCTGNAARSVMAGAMWRQLAPDWTVATAGTHVIEGQPMSRRTQEAMARLGFAANGHRSRQLSSADLAAADLVAGFEIWHIEYIRRMHPDVADRTATLKRWCAVLAGTSGPVGRRVASAGVGRAQLEPWEEVDDPAGGDVEVVAACAREVLGLITSLAGLLATPPGADTLPVRTGEILAAEEDADGR